MSTCRRISGGCCNFPLLITRGRYLFQILAEKPPLANIGGLCWFSIIRHTGALSASNSDLSAGQTRGKLALPSAVDVRLRRSLNELRSSKFEQRSNDDLCMRCTAEKALKSKAGSTQRVWEDYAELIAVALVNATITTDATATKTAV